MIFPFHDDNPVRRTPFVTFAIVGVNVAVFLGTLALSKADRQMLWYGRGFVPARIAQLAHGKPIEVVQKMPDPSRPGWARLRRIRFSPQPGQILLSLLTCMFLHGGWFHLIGNMWFLWIFGNNVEDRLGHVLYLLLYLVGGLAASLCHWMFKPGEVAPVIGASGAVAAMLGAYAITWPWARVRSLVFLLVIVTIVELPALLVLGFWFLAQLIAATSTASHQMSGGVAWWAHVGGFLAGLVLMPVFSQLTGAAKDQQTEEPVQMVDLEEFDEFLEG